MSPELCESKPYSYKCDVWALGVILYELCTLNHPFMSENLLALVFKIVKDTYSPIPEFYSDNLRNLVDFILNKD